jgi:DNA-binding transcriptional ArsR family regulator
MLPGPAESTGEMNPVLEATLGNRTAAWTLLFIANYGEGHALRIARTFDLSVSMVQRQLSRLEGNGILVSRTVGRARVFSFNDRNPTVRNLRRFLTDELELLSEEDVRRYFRQRQRPRRSGKPL